MHDWKKKKRNLNEDLALRRITSQSGFWDFLQTIIKCEKLRAVTLALFADPVRLTNMPVHPQKSSLFEKNKFP